MSSITEPIASSRSAQPDILSRRRLVQLAGVTLIGTAFYGTSGCAARGQGARFAPSPAPPVQSQSIGGVGVGALLGGSKPVYVPQPGSEDPVEHSVADTLFWGEQMMEHAMFFVMLMPGPELAQARGQAQGFQDRFAAHLATLRRSRLDRSNFARFNDATIALTRPFVDYKRTMQEQQESGRLRSLVWPQFFEHTRHEGERFITRLDRLNQGETAFRRAEIVPFWSQVMGEHAEFIAHLLDPGEETLIAAARQTSATFQRLRSSAASDESVRRAADEIIDFKTAAERGIQTGQIKSIIHPALADHVRREAVRFRHELSRAV